jgi:dephospho-CoA kinase
MLKVGLTGGIGSGKSTVAKLFEELGVAVIDADAIAREIVQPEYPAFGKIVDHFGKDILDEQGWLNRQRIRDIIFTNPDHRQWLEDLLHPIILSEMQKRIPSVASSYCILVIPLLIESPQSQAFVDRILLVDAPESTRLTRTKHRDNASVDQVRLMMQSQARAPERLELADEVIVNDRNLKHLKSEVKRLHEFYLTLA